MRGSRPWGGCFIDRRRLRRLVSWDCGVVSRRRPPALVPGRCSGGPDRARWAWLAPRRRRPRPPPRTRSAASTRPASTRRTASQGRRPRSTAASTTRRGSRASGRVATRSRCRPRAHRPPSRPSSRSCTTTGTSTSRSAPTTTPRRSTATRAGATTSPATSSASASTATTTSGPASSSTSPPGGSKIDLILGNGETEWDTTWDAVWDGKVGHDEKGWTAEFRVPLNQLRYGPQEQQVWGMHAWRWIDRNQEEDQWQLIPRQNTGRMYQLGELHGIRGLPRRASRRAAAASSSRRPAPARPSPEEGQTARARLGLDAKVGLTSNFTLDATVNPDFGQVEADPSVVNLTAYETFYEEKRPFFLEGRKILTFDDRGGGPALLLAAHRGRRPPGPLLGRASSEPARQHDDPGGVQGDGEDGRGAVGRRPPGVHPEGDASP